jgi:hypothetical protein
MIANSLKQENKVATQNPPNLQSPHSDKDKLQTIPNPTEVSRQDFVPNTVPNQIHDRGLKTDEHSAPQSLEMKTHRKPPTTPEVIKHFHPQEWTMRITRRMMERSVMP